MNDYDLLNQWLDYLLCCPYALPVWVAAGGVLVVGAWEAVDWMRRG